MCVVFVSVLARVCACAGAFGCMWCLGVCVSVCWRVYVRVYVCACVRVWVRVSRCVCVCWRVWVHVWVVFGSVCVRVYV